jgi:hypothetical protein
MNSRAKTIVLTVIATTAAWVLAITTFLFWIFHNPSPRNDVIDFFQEQGSLGGFGVHNPKTNTMVVLIEQLPMGAETNRIPLARRSLAPGGKLIIRARRISEDADDAK